jgi:hypothetical protein
MRTNHQLARLKAHSLGNIATYGDSYENGIFSKNNTFGRVNPPRAILSKRAQSTALTAKGDQLDDGLPTTGQGMQEPNFGSYGLGAGPASAAYFGSDPAMVRKEGGIMNSVTTFGEATDSDENGVATHSHTTQYMAGGGGTVLLLLAGYFALKWTRRI